MTNALAVSNLALAYPVSGGVQTVLDIEELQVEAGLAVGLTGPSGSGKTSLLYVLAGLERPQHGTVCWGDTDIASLPESERDRWRRQHVGMVFQDFHLFPGMSALQNVVLPATFAHVAIPVRLKRRASDLLKEVGLNGGQQRVETLSRGELQRVAVARALLFAPPIVLADEPTASLDTASGDRVTELLLGLCKDAGSTLVVVSHDARVLGRLDAVGTLVRGHFLTGRAVGSC